MQITQSKLVGIIHDDRIYIRDIDTTFHNVGANKHIIFPVDKIKNSLFKLMTLHLPMSITNAQIRTKTLYNICHFGQATDAIEYEKDLASSFCFKIDRIPNHVFIIYLHFG